MTSVSNTQQLERLRRERARGRLQLVVQLRLLDQLAAGRASRGAPWQAQLAALAELIGDELALVLSGVAADELQLVKQAVRPELVTAALHAAKTKA